MSKDCTNCNKCQGTKVSSHCIILEDIETEKSLNELIVELIEFKDKKHKIDLKTLSTNVADNDDPDKAIQLLINEEVKRKAATTSPTSVTVTDVTALQTTIAQLQAQVNQLQAQVTQLTQLM